jgi:hypothetical protein
VDGVKQVAMLGDVLDCISLDKREGIAAGPVHQVNADDIKPGAVVSHSGATFATEQVK